MAAFIFLPAKTVIYMLFEISLCEIFSMALSSAGPYARQDLCLWTLHVV
jgi:hypothetical protein